MWPFSLFRKKKKYRPTRPFIRAELPPFREKERARDLLGLEDPISPLNPASPLSPLHQAQTTEPPPHHSHNPIPDPPPPIEHQSHHTPMPDMPHHDHGTNSFDFGGHHH